ncbi:MAG: DUF6629 family protein [Deltaproteobacteria bacterium]
MCFSATASFVAAAISGTAGAVCLARVRYRGDLLLAATPLVFAVQQTIEGSLWLNLEHEGFSERSAELTTGFLMLALVFWPIYVPLATLLAEPDRRRRLWLWASLAAGLCVAVYFFISLGALPRTASIDGGHIVYSSDPALPLLIRFFYPAATSLSLMLSSHRVIAVSGVVIFIGSVVSYWMYWNAFTSVWCFFAAIASLLVIVHFEKVRRARAADDRRARMALPR